MHTAEDPLGRKTKALIQFAGRYLHSATEARISVDWLLGSRSRGIQRAKENHHYRHQYARAIESMSSIDICSLLTQLHKSVEDKNGKLLYLNQIYNNNV